MTHAALCLILAAGSAASALLLRRFYQLVLEELLSRDRHALEDGEVQPW